MYQSQGIVKRFNRMLAEWLFGYQYVQEMLNPQERNVKWVARLPEVMKALNEVTTRLIQTDDGLEIAPAQAIELSCVKQLPEAPEAEIPSNAIKAKIPPNAIVHYLSKGNSDSLFCVIVYKTCSSDQICSW